MFCTRCRDLRLTVTKKLDLQEFRIKGNIERIDCAVCENFISITENNRVINIDEIVHESIEGWKQVRTNREYIIYYVLSQIIYPEIDTPREEKLESFYDFADDSDHIFLRWLNGQPVGFYTIKPKGSEDESKIHVYMLKRISSCSRCHCTEIFNSQLKYSMNTIDTAYIRNECRNQGLGMEILYDVLTRYRNPDIGFSKPISHGMLRVIKRFLIKHKEYRLHFWEIEDGGTEGFTKLIWFALKKQLHC